MKKRVLAITIPLLLAACSLQSNPFESEEKTASIMEGSGQVRTVIYIYKQTTVGQDIFIRGGHDRDLYNQGHYSSMAENISYNNTLNPTTSSLKATDNSLDWFSDSALDWTTDAWPSSWGTARYYLTDGYGEDPENFWGHHWWKFDVMMDGDAGDWFEFKAFMRQSGVEYWESDIDQPGTPFSSINHWAKKGYITKVVFGESGAEFFPLDQAPAAEPVTVEPAVPVPGQSITIQYQGTYKYADNLTLYYGYNGWNQVSGMSGLQIQPDDGNNNYYKETPMASLSGGGFECQVDIPAGVRAVHFLFYWNDNGVKKWDSNNGKDYRKSVVFPYIGPFLTWNDTTAAHSGVVVNFETSAACTATIEYGTAPSLGQSITETDEAVMHHFVLNGLAPDTVYYYRVNDGRGNVSSLYQFRTGVDGDEDYKYIVMSDMQDNGDDRRWSDIAKEVLNNHSDARFIILPGDMPWDDEPGHWWTFFDKGKDLFASKVVMPAVGNHDTPSTGSDPDSSSYRYYFDLPLQSGSETYYRFDYGNARFFSLNSEIPGEFDPNGGSQYQWMTQQIADLWVNSQKQKEWAFSYWHIPPYDIAKRHWSQQGSFRDMTGLFDGTVDWVFNGHEHLNHRIKPMRYNARISSEWYSSALNTGYIIVPPAGNHPETEIINYDDAKAYYRDRAAFPLFGSTQNHVDSQIGFVTVEIDHQSIDIRTYGMGTLVSPQSSYIRDSVSYTK